MRYCCTDFEIVVKDGGLIKQSDCTWVTVGHLFCKFCPFCGKSLGSRFMIDASNLHGYFVWLDGKTVGHFDTRAEAEEYVLLH